MVKLMLQELLPFEKHPVLWWSPAMYSVKTSVCQGDACLSLQRRRQAWLLQQDLSCPVCSHSAFIHQVDELNGLIHWLLAPSWQEAGLSWPCLLCTGANEQPVPHQGGTTSSERFYFNRFLLPPSPGVVVTSLPKGSLAHERAGRDKQGKVDIALQWSDQILHLGVEAWLLRLPLHQMLHI